MAVSYYSAAKSTPRMRDVGEVGMKVFLHCLMTGLGPMCHAQPNPLGFSG